MKKIIYLLIVMIVLLGMAPVPATAKKGTGMYISEIEGRVGVVYPSGYRFTVLVYIVDVDGNPVGGAKVLASTTATTKIYSTYTDEYGRAEFFIYTNASSLTLTVDNVIKHDYIYLPEMNVESFIYIKYEP